MAGPSNLFTTLDAEVTPFAGFDNRDELRGGRLGLVFRDGETAE
jgi:hypothetical protein